MFREFNVEFENVEMINDADNLLEGTEVTKVIMKGDNQMSSLNSFLKNCDELDTIQGGLSLGGVSDIGNILEGNTLIKSIYLKDINNQNISANNSFPNIEEITIGGELYNKKALQNVIASKEWTFDNISYVGVIGENVFTNSVEIINSDSMVISDTLEQKAKGMEIIGQTYENLVDGTGEYELNDPYNATVTESNNSLDNPPSLIEIPEIWGNTIQDETDLSNVQSVGDLYVDEDGEPILDDEGNEQYKLEIIANNGNLINLRNLTANWINELDIDTPNSFTATAKLVPQWNTQWVKVRVPVKANRTYIVGAKFDSHSLESKSTRVGVRLDGGTEYFIGSGTSRRFNVGDTDGVFDIVFYPMYGKLEDYNIDPITSRVSLYVEEANTIQFIEREESIQTILMPQPLSKEGDSYDKLCWNNSKGKYLVETITGGLIETKILEPVVLETYSPKTYISTNTEIQPSQMTITNKKTVIIPEFLDPNKNYTIKFNCTKKGDKPITVNLGGNVLDVDATLGENIIEITTPELIDNKELVLNGNGNIVTDVFVIADNMSTGELQDGGTYKFIISATNTVDTHNMSMIATKPLGTNERLYWNNSNKRYEIDRNGEIEIPIVEGEAIDLPRLYQRETTNIKIETGNIKPGKIKVEYLDID